MRKVETVTERSLRRSRAARALAAEAASEPAARVRRATARMSAYQRAVRSGSVAAAGMFAVIFGSAGSAPDRVVSAGAMVAVPAGAMAAMPSVDARSVAPGATAAAVPFGSDRIVLASVRTDEAFTVSDVVAPKRFLARPADRAAPPVPLSSGISISATMDVAGEGMLPLIAIIPSMPDVSGLAVERSLKPRYRPVRADGGYADPEAASRTCGFGSIVQRGSTTFHRPPTCI